MNRLAIGQGYSGENKMKINLKFGTKKEPVQTGLQVHTHMLAGSNCEDICKLRFQSPPGLEKFFNPRLNDCISQCAAA